MLLADGHVGSDGVSLEGTPFPGPCQLLVAGFPTRHTLPACQLHAANSMPTQAPSWNHASSACHAACASAHRSASPSLWTTGLRT
jgi:hypothetical protein